MKKIEKFGRYGRLRPSTVPASDLTSKNAIGGTELMKKWLFEEIAKKDPNILDEFQIILTKVEELESDKKRILWIHDLASNPVVNHLQHKENLKKFDKIVFVSHWQQYQFNASFLNVPYEKGIVLQNAITPIPKHEKPNDGKIKVCYFSTPHRGLEVLLDAWNYMRNDLQLGLNAELNIYSSFKIYGWKDKEEEEFKHIYERAKEMDNINYYGTVSNENIRKMLESNHIMAYPSTYAETSCICLLEAMSAGCLSVISNFGALPETSANFAKMYNYVQDPKKHAQVHGKMLAHAIEKFWDDDVQNLLKIQQNYFNMFYNWKLRVTQWLELLNSIRRK